MVRLVFRPYTQIWRSICQNHSPHVSVGAGLYLRPPPNCFGCSPLPSSLWTFHTLFALKQTRWLGCGLANLVPLLPYPGSLPWPSRVSLPRLGVHELSGVSRNLAVSQKTCSFSLASLSGHFLTHKSIIFFIFRKKKNWSKISKSLNFRLYFFKFRTIIKIIYNYIWCSVIKWLTRRRLVCCPPKAKTWATCAATLLASTPHIWSLKIIAPTWAANAALEQLKDCSPAPAATLSMRSRRWSVRMSRSAWLSQMCN